MVALMLFRVVGVDGVSHISRDDETSLDGLFKGVFSELIRVSSLQDVEDSSHILRDNSGISALSRVGSDFFMIE
jgi:hypothetical protein